MLTLENIESNLNSIQMAVDEGVKNFDINKCGNNIIEVSWKNNLVLLEEEDELEVLQILTSGIKYQALLPIE